MRAAPIAVLTCLPILLGAPASGFYEVGGGEIIAVTSLSLTYDSNVSGATSDGEGDFFLQFSPSLRFLRNEGRASVNARVGLNGTRYFENSDLDFLGYNASLSSSLPTAAGSPFSGSVSLNGTLKENLDPFTNVRTEVTSWTGTFSGGYSFTDRLQVTAGVNYSEADRSAVSSSTTYGVNVGINRRIRTELRAGVTARVTRQTSSGDFSDGSEESEIENLSLNATLSGPITERINGNLSVGFQRSEEAGAAFNNDRSDGTVVTAANLSWNPRDRTSVSLRASRSVELTSEDRSVTSNNFNLNVSQRFTNKISGSLRGSYTRASGRADDRTDQIYTIAANASYDLNRYWSITASASQDFRDTSASVDIFRATLGTSFSY